MKKVQAAVRNMLPAVVMTVSLLMVCRPVIAENLAAEGNTWAQEQPAPQPGDQYPMSETKTFAGKIVKAGDKLVLSDAQGKTYQLDDQQKAQEFVNKTVKVTGILDPSTGMIRVRAIGPA
ncbi:MAG: hypothetical protein LAN83_19520 [Acidobacteriia bacterium]|nr:hypothetical protein [Terriglobia bacterium]